MNRSKMQDAAPSRRLDQEASWDGCQKTRAIQPRRRRRSKRSLSIRGERLYIPLTYMHRVYNGLEEDRPRIVSFESVWRCREFEKRTVENVNDNRD